VLSNRWNTGERRGDGRIVARQAADQFTAAVGALQGFLTEQAAALGLQSVKASHRHRASAALRRV